MEILMIAPEPFFEPRGTPFSVRDRLIGLSLIGHNVDLVTYHIGGDIQIPNITIHRIPNIPFIKNVKIGPSWKKLILDLVVFIKTFQLLRKKSYFVIHSHEEAAFFSMFLSKIFSVRHLYDMHSSLPKQLQNSKYGNIIPAVKLFKILEKAVIKSCDALITIAEDLYIYAESIDPDVNQILIENIALQLDVEKDEAIIQLKRNINLNGQFPIVYTGNLERYQGVDLLIESASIVKEKETNIVFIIVGGNSRGIDVLKKKVAELQIEDIFHFTGVVSPEESLAYMSMAKLLVSPRVEGTTVPLKIYSYMNSGKPILATRLSAHTQVLDESVACLVDPNAQAIATGILKIIENPEYSNQLGQNAVNLIREKHNFADYVSRVARIYQTLGTN